MTPSPYRTLLVAAAAVSLSLLTACGKKEEPKAVAPTPAETAAKDAAAAIKAAGEASKEASSKTAEAAKEAAKEAVEKAKAASTTQPAK